MKRDSLEVSEDLGELFSLFMELWSEDNRVKRHVSETANQTHRQADRQIDRQIDRQTREKLMKFSLRRFDKKL